MRTFFGGIAMLTTALLSVSGATAVAGAPAIQEVVYSKTDGFYNSDRDLAECRSILTNRATRSVTVSEILRLLPSGLSKSEFESTVAFKARVAGKIKAAEQEIYKRTHTQHVVISVNIKPQQVSYDADKSIMSVSGDLEAFTPRVDEYVSLLTEQRSTNLGTYVGSNAFGARTNVRVTKWDELGVIGFWSNEGYQTSQTVKIDDAKSAKHNLRLVLVGSLADPYIAHAQHTIAPTIRYPTELHIDVTAIGLLLKCAVLFDPNRERIYNIEMP